jgi:hypothetical protein
MSETAMNEREYGAVEGLHQTLGRLGDYLEERVHVRH